MLATPCASSGWMASKGQPLKWTSEDPSTDREGTAGDLKPGRACDLWGSPLRVGCECGVWVQQQDPDQQEWIFYFRATDVSRTVVKINLAAASQRQIPDSLRTSTTLCTSSVSPEFFFVDFCYPREHLVTTFELFQPDNAFGLPLALEPW